MRVQIEKTQSGKKRADDGRCSSGYAATVLSFPQPQCRGTLGNLPGRGRGSSHGARGHGTGPSLPALQPSSRPTVSRRLCPRRNLCGSTSCLRAGGTVAPLAPLGPEMGPAAGSPVQRRAAGVNGSLQMAPPDRTGRGMSFRLSVSGDLPEAKVAARSKRFLQRPVIFRGNVPTLPDDREQTVKRGKKRRGDHLPKSCTIF